MSVEKQIVTLFKFHSFYEETPEDFLDQTDVEKFFHHKIFDFF